MLFFAIVPFSLFSNINAKDVKYPLGGDNDTINVCIKVDSIYNMQSSIQYVDSTGNDYSLDPSKTMGFCLYYNNDRMYFESRKNLKMILFGLKKSRSSFIQQVSTGNLTLCYFVKKKLVMDGVDMISSHI